MNHQMGMNNVAARHGEYTSQFSGSLMPADKNASYIEVETYKSYLKIKAAALSSSLTAEQISYQFLLQHLDDLEMYVRSKGENPSTANNGIIVQAILLRMQDIHVISAAGKLSEDDALKEIQEAESEAFLLNTSDKDLVLSPDVQAALNCLIVVLLTKMGNATGTSDITGALNLISKSMVTPLNNADGSDSSDGSIFDFLDPTDESGSGNDLPAASTVNLPAAASTGTAGDSSDSFFSTLDKIAATAQTVSGSTASLSKSISSGILNVSNAIQTATSNVGASSISLYLQRNGMMILIILAIVIVLSLMLTRATRS